MLNNSKDCSNGGKDDNLDRINEKCVECQRHFIRIEDVRVGILDDQYYHAHCAKELHIDVCECRDI